MNQIRQQILESLEAEFKNRKKKNPRYSMNSYAKSLGMNDSTLAKIMRGEREIGRRYYLLLCEKLKIPIDEVNFNELKRARRKMNYGFKKLDLDTLKIDVDLKHFAALELRKLKSFRDDSHWISKKLNLPESETKTLIHELEDLGWLVRKDGRWVSPLDRSSSLPTPKTTNAKALRMQKSFLKESLKSVESHAPDIRNHTSMIMACNEEEFSFIVDQLRSFRRSLADRLEKRGSEKRDIYALQMGLFPLTQIEDLS